MPSTMADTVMGTLIRRFCRTCGRTTDHRITCGGSTQRCNDCNAESRRYDLKPREWAGH